jgi:anti-sigma-K factor RskA
MPLDNLDPLDREVLYELYALALLEPDQMAEIRARLDRGDAETVAGVRKALALTSALAHVAPEKKPANALRRRLLLAAGAPERRFGWQWVLGFAALSAALLAIVFNVYQDVQRRETQIAALRQQLDASQQLVAQAKELYDFLGQPGTINVRFGDGQPAPPRGQIFINRTRGVLLFAGNLPNMPAGKIFEMWFVPKGGGAPIPAGLFRADSGQGVHFQRGAVDPATIAAIAVTLEPESGSTTPTMPILFAAPVQAE